MFVRGSHINVMWKERGGRTAGGSGVILTDEETAVVLSRRIGLSGKFAASLGERKIAAPKQIEAAELILTMRLSLLKL